MNKALELTEKIDWQKAPNGLVPAIIQAQADRAVLMMAWMNEEALVQTMATGKVTFFSRSRNCLWTKGETSGNYLELVSVAVDCDGDTLLVTVNPTGPACHTGSTTCFGEPPSWPVAFLATLQSVIQDRKGADPESSYTAQLLNGPFPRIAQKVGEEAVETVLASMGTDHEELVNESADLIYHLLVLLAAKGSSIESVANCLQDRHAGK